MRLASCLLAVMFACGRSGFGPPPGDASDGDGTDGGESDPDAVVGDAAFPASGDWVVGTTACAASPMAVTLTREVLASETLAVAFFMREPMTPTPPSITGAAGFATDVSFSTTTGSNQRHLSVFRTAGNVVYPVGTTVTITHPGGQSWAAVALALPGLVAFPDPVTAEGVVPPFSAMKATNRPTCICIETNYNLAAATFDAGWAPMAEVQAPCGESRRTARLKIATMPCSATTTCSGTLSDDVGWAVALVGYTGLVQM